MNMMIKDKKIRSDFKTASHLLGVNENDLFKRAVTFYLHTLKDKIAPPHRYESLKIKNH